MTAWLFNALLLMAVTLLCALLGRVIWIQLVRYHEWIAERLDFYLIEFSGFSSTTAMATAWLVMMPLSIAALSIAGVSIVLLLATVALALMLPSIAFLVLHKRRISQINQCLPDAMAQIAAAVRAGATFQSALQAQVNNTQGALTRELDQVLSERRVGVHMEQALENMAERVASEEVDLMVSAVSIAQEVGGNLADTLQALSETVRRKIEMEGKIQSLTAQGRLQGHVVTSVPLLMLGGLIIVEPEITLPIFSCLLGWGTLLVIGLMLLAGGLVIRKIVSIDI